MNLIRSPLLHYCNYWISNECMIHLWFFNQKISYIIVFIKKKYVSQNKNASRVIYEKVSIN